MSLVQRNHVVEQLTPTASNPALSHSILPGTSNRRLHRCDLHRMDRGGDLKTILCVVVKDDEPVSRLIRKSFAQLLDDPTAGRMPRDIDRSVKRLAWQYCGDLRLVRGDEFGRNSAASHIDNALRRFKSKLQTEDARSAQTGWRCPAMIRMMATTINSSISEKPFCRFRISFSLVLDFR
jgi:hypothetical protein